MSRKSTELTPELYAYLLKHSLREASVLQELREETAHHEWAVMQIAPEQGQFMALLVRLLGAKRCLEIGVFTGYSALAVALALPPEGHVVACDVNAEWTQIARKFWAQAGVDHKIDLHIAPALETLDQLLASGAQSSFDFAFIDADKTNYDSYYERSLQLVRPGGLIVIDNVLWSGRVADNSAQDADTRALQALNAKLATDERIDLSMLPVADGLTLALKR